MKKSWLATAAKNWFRYQFSLLSVYWVTFLDRRIYTFLLAFWPIDHLICTFCSIFQFFLLSLNCLLQHFFLRQHRCFRLVWHYFFTSNNWSSHFSIFLSSALDVYFFWVITSLWNNYYVWVRRKSSIQSGRQFLLIRSLCLMKFHCQSREKASLYFSIFYSRHLFYCFHILSGHFASVWNLCLLHASELSVDQSVLVRVF